MLFHVQVRPAPLPYSGHSGQACWQWETSMLRKLYMDHKPGWRRLWWVTILPILIFVCQMQSTAFCRPAAAAVGGLWAERLEKSARRPSKRYLTYGGSHQLQCYIAGRQLIAKSFARDRPFTKICPAPSASWSLVLKMKKLLNDGLDLTWWPRGEN